MISAWWLIPAAMFGAFAVVFMLAICRSGRDD